MASLFPADPPVMCAGCPAPRPVHRAFARMKADRHSATSAAIPWAPCRRSPPWTPPCAWARPFGMAPRLRHKSGRKQAKKAVAVHRRLHLHAFRHHRRWSTSSTTWASRHDDRAGQRHHRHDRPPAEPHHRPDPQKSAYPRRRFTSKSSAMAQACRRGERAGGGSLRHGGD